MDIVTFSHGTFTDVVLQARNQNQEDSSTGPVPSGPTEWFRASVVQKKKRKRSACEICVPLFAGDYRLAHTPKSFVDCANITLEVCSVTKHRNNEVQSAVTCELVE